MQLDVADKKQVAALFDQVPEELRQVDILGTQIASFNNLILDTTYRHYLVNNAGFVLGVEKIGDIADADVEGMFAVNVLGLISVTQLLVKREFAHARLLSICSPACKRF